MTLKVLSDFINQTIPESVTWHCCTNRHFDKNIPGLLFLHHFHLKIWLSWHLAQQGKVQVVIKQETGNNTKQDLFKEALLHKDLLE